MPNQSVIVLDFGGQYNQLIARRVRECNVYCEVKPNTMTVDEIRAFDPIGIIFTGGPQSVYAEGSPQVDPEIFRLGIPRHLLWLPAHGTVSRRGSDRRRQRHRA